MDKIISRFPSNFKQFFKLKPDIQFMKIPFQTSIKNDDFNLSLLTWNTLADGYADPYKFYYVKPEFLKEEHRMPMIAYDLLRIDSDIICLQELEERNFKKFLIPYLSEYNGNF